MAKICDRSPCDPLLGALGNWIFGSSEGFIISVVTASDRDAEIDIDYCPFCGTRLEEVGAVVVEKYTRPRKRKKSLRSPAA